MRPCANATCAKAETQDHQQEVLPARNEIALVVMQHSSCELSNVSHTALFLEFDLARINSPWHKIHVLIISRPCHEPLLHVGGVLLSLCKNGCAHPTFTRSLCLTSCVLSPSGQRRERTTAGCERHNRSGMGRGWVGHSV